MPSNTLARERPAIAVKVAHGSRSLDEEPSISLSDQV
jgi:hypothetical protein